MSRFFVDFFCLAVPKSLKGNRSVPCFGKFPVAKKFVDEKDGGEYQKFLPKTFCLTVPKNFVGEPSRVSLISVIEKFYAQRNMSRFFVEFFCLAVPKNLKGNRSVMCFGKFPVAKKFVDEKDGVGSIKNFCRKRFVSEKFGGGPFETFCLENPSVVFVWKFR